MSEISLFERVSENTPSKNISLDYFINQVKLGEWRDQVIKVRNAEDKKTRDGYKKNLLPGVTISGTFKVRRANQMDEHSGFICIDFDNLENVDQVFNNLCQDKYTYACFRSASGQGLATIVKIDPRRHLDAFLGLETYYAETYDLFIDRSCKDVSRFRFVTYDPETYSSADSSKFTKYIPKSEIVNKKKIPNVITGDNDIRHIIDQIQSNSIDLTESSYFRWLEIGFAISEEYGEAGREYFHAVSQFSYKYTPEKADKQYDRCLKSSNTGVTIATFLYHCKNANISIVSDKTKHIVSVAAMRKKGGAKAEQVVQLLWDIDEITEEESEAIVEKVFAREDIGDSSKLPKLESIEVFINSNYNIKRNEITRYLEENGEEINDMFINSMWIRARKEVDDRITKVEVECMLNSDFTENYNPLVEFFERHGAKEESTEFQKLVDSIHTPQPREYVETFLRKWLIGIVRSAHGGHCPLLLCLVGEGNTGKTEFFRRLLPKELAAYYANSKLDAGKDDEILMCQKLLILDDEFGGKSKFESKKLKELTSKDVFTLREPYGRKNINMRRIAVLAGTSNELQVINDPTGNRRVIPIEVTSRDWDLFDSIDKKLLFMEVYQWFLNGETHNLKKEDVQLLRDNTLRYTQHSQERELILKYFHSYKSIEVQTHPQLLQLTEIAEYLAHCSNLKITQPKLAAELNSLGFKSKEIYHQGQSRIVFTMCKVENHGKSIKPDENNKKQELW